VLPGVSTCPDHCAVFGKIRLPKNCPAQSISKRATALLTRFSGQVLTPGATEFFLLFRVQIVDFLDLVRWVFVLPVDPEKMPSRVGKFGINMNMSHKVRQKMHVKYILRGNVQFIVTVCLPTFSSSMNFWKSSVFIQAKIASSWAFVDSPSAQIDGFV
jgi:hypothetical protein